MKHFSILLWTLCCGPFLNAQPVDSLAIRQVDSLIQVSQEWSKNRNFEQALKSNEDAENIAILKFGKESAAYGKCCYNHGDISIGMGDFTGAELWHIQAKSIRERVLGPDHPDYATSLFRLANLYNFLGQYLKAEPLYAESMSIREKVLGKDHPDYAASLNNLAILYENTNQFEKAEPLYLQALDIREKKLGKDNLLYAFSLNGLGALYYHMGLYEKTEPLWLEAMDIREKAVGRDHPDYALSLNNLAALYDDLGLFEKSEAFHLEALSIRKKHLGADHPEYAESLNNLANLYEDMGLYDKAESMFLEAMSIREKTLGKENLDYAGNINNLAGIYQDQGKYEKAESLYLESKAIKKKILGTNHPDYARALHNLASLYSDRQQMKLAETFYLEAKSIREKSLGRDHPDFISTLMNLAVFYGKAGQYTKTKALLFEAKAVLEKTLGKGNPDYSDCIYHLGVLYFQLGQYDSAGIYITELSAMNRRMMERSLHHLSEKELNQYLNTFIKDQNLVLHLAQKAGSRDLMSTCYDNSLFYKGFLLESAGRIRQLALSDDRSTETFYRLKGYHRQLAAQLTKPFAERDSARILQLENQANDLEKELTRTIAGYGDAMRQVTWPEVQSALSRDAISLEFVQYDNQRPDGAQFVQYAVLLLRPGAATPLLIPLFEETELEFLLQRDIQRKAEYVKGLYAWADRGLIPSDQARKSLYELIWSKIEATGLEGITTVYFSPTGVLHRLNLGAIAIDEGTILSDRYNLVELNSTRQLVIPDKVPRTSKDALLVGGVQFDEEVSQPAAIDESLASSRSMTAAWSGSGPRHGLWSPLTWTAREVGNISTTLSSSGYETITYRGPEATEEAVKTIGTVGPSPHVLHLATHGFFFPDPEVKKEENSGLDESEPVFKGSDNPMVRSGLVLAGGNYAWEHGRAIRPDREDGILTAAEISQMNLANTELVVLSACETGLGDIKGNEGVYGLQRAFKIAGAKYLIMSLWQVPDPETMAFMTTFYRNWLEQNMTIPDAFRQTQLDMRDRFLNPYAWAGFVLVE